MYHRLREHERARRVDLLGDINPHNRIDKGAEPAPIVMFTANLRAHGPWLDADLNATSAKHVRHVVLVMDHLPDTAHWPQPAPVSVAVRAHTSVLRRVLALPSLKKLALQGILSQREESGDLGTFVQVVFDGLDNKTLQINENLEIRMDENMFQAFAERCSPGIKLKLVPHIRRVITYQWTDAIGETLAQCPNLVSLKLVFKFKRFRASDISVTDWEMCRPQGVADSLSRHFPLGKASSAVGVRVEVQNAHTVAADDWGVLVRVLSTAFAKTEQLRISCTVLYKNQHEYLAAGVASLRKMLPSCKIVYNVLVFL